MKLLFDQNISYRIVKDIQEIFPGSKQVKELKLEGATDLQVWTYAKRNDFTIVTFDSDFSDIAVLKGVPPKIIWFRTGNVSTDKITNILTNKEDDIKYFLSFKNAKQVACLEITD